MVAPPSQSSMCANSSVVVRSTFPAMGNTAMITSIAHSRDIASRALLVGTERVQMLESSWSRFLPDSEVSKFNEGRQLNNFSADTQLLFEHMAQATARTGGLFDARILPEVLKIGYDSSLVDARRASGASHSLAVDPGGIGKGLAADLAVSSMLEHGCTGALVSVGGDIRCCGTPDRDNGWIIEVQSAHDETIIGRVALDDGAIATSGFGAKRWACLGAHRTHIVDPSTHASIDSRQREVVQATVVASTAAWAEVYATACLVADMPAALALLDRAGLAGLLQRHDGSAFASINWSRYT